MMSDVLDVIKNIPVIQFHHLSDSDSEKIFVKYEGMNMIVFIKTKTAYHMIQETKNQGLI